MNAIKLYEDNTPQLLKEGLAVAWDTETDLIAEGNVVTTLICSSFATPGEEGKVVSHLEERHDELLESMLESCLSIGHNIAFDLSVAARRKPELLPLIWKALREGRVRDTMIREQLLNLTMHGNIDIIENHGINAKIDYSLAGLVKHYLDIDISEDKHAEDSARLNYSVVQYQPIEEWPDNFVEYAADDAKYTGLVFLEQEIARKACFDKIGYDPFKVEQFRVRAAFSLRLLEAQGIKLDPVKVLEVTKEFQEHYNEPRLVEPLAKYGIVVKATPPLPNARGTKDHQPDCRGHKEHPEWKKGKTVKDCQCPVKMNKGKEEATSVKTLHSYVWGLALDGKCEAWISDSTITSLKQDGDFDQFINGQNKVNIDAVQKTYMEGGVVVGKSTIPKIPLPDKWKLSIDKEWMANFSSCDPIIELYDERKKIQKIVTSYLPHLYTEDHDVPPASTKEQEADRYYGKKPAPRAHPSFSVLKRTGRTSSFGSKFYPSFNGQQVDPRIRECCIPEEGRLFFSVDYSGMELCTAAQTAYNMFGYSVLRDKINAGVDTHAFLGAQIASALDPMFRQAVSDLSDPDEDRRDAAYRIFSLTKGDSGACSSEYYAALGLDKNKWADFFNYYRKFAKPTGLGYPGGLGPNTFVQYAKGGYGISVTLDTAKELREIWRGTYPELKEYLAFVGKQCIDPHHAPDVVMDDDGAARQRQWYSYDTPMGMHRAKCDYCSCANGKALQAIGAEGALNALQEVAEECSTGSLTGKVFPNNFIHDEITGEVVMDGNEHEYLRKIQDIMEEHFAIVTPDVTIGTEAALMYRWNKRAEPVYDSAGRLIPWEPEKKEEGKAVPETKKKKKKVKAVQEPKERPGAPKAKKKSFTYYARYYYLASGMDGRADEKDYGHFSAGSDEEAVARAVDMNKGTWGLSVYRLEGQREIRLTLSKEK